MQCERQGRRRSSEASDGAMKRYETAAQKRLYVLWRPFQRTYLDGCVVSRGSLAEEGKKIGLQEPRFHAAESLATGKGVKPLY